MDNIKTISTLKLQSILIFVLLICSSGFAQDISYLEGMPAPQQVLEYFKNEKDSYNRSAKQYLTFEFLQYIVAQIANERDKSGYTSKEKKIAGSYLKAQSLIYSYNVKNQSHKKVSHWNSIIHKFGADKQFFHDIINNLLMPKASAQFEQANTYSVNKSKIVFAKYIEVKKAKERLNILPVIFISGIFFFLSIRLIFKSHHISKGVIIHNAPVKRRKFARAQTYLNWGFKMGIISFILFGFSLVYFLSRL
jgi:hypothetical protein